MILPLFCALSLFRNISPLWYVVVVVVVVLTLTHRHNTMQSVHGRRTGSNISGVSGRNTSVVKQRRKQKQKASIRITPLRTPGKQKRDYS